MRIKLLNDYIKILQDNDLVKELKINEKDLNAEVEHISYNSLEVEEGTLFVCKGGTFKESFLQSAISKGAFCYVYGEDFSPKENYDESYIVVNDIRKTLAAIANLYYDKCWDKLGMIGITGTKGKTTVAYYARDIIEKAFEKKIGFLSSNVTYDGTKEVDAVLTTPETFELHSLFNTMVTNELKHNLMEVSSQALKYHRTYGIIYDIGCFTNISTDHISAGEHRDFDDYFNSKLLLMDQCKVAIINNDLEERYREQIIKRAKNSPWREKIILYGEREGSQIRAKDIKATIQGLDFTLEANNSEINIHVPMIGRFNVSNALAAVAIGISMGISISVIKDALNTVYVPGRVNVAYNKEKDVIGIVDFAHNKLSCEALRDTVLELKPNASYTQVFGCPGVKGLNRRKDIGEVVNTFCNRIILTEEDTGTDNFEDIVNEISKYITDKNIEIVVIENREEAVEYAFKTAKQGEVVIVAGKGSDTTIKRGKVYCPIRSDIELMNEYI